MNGAGAKVSVTEYTGHGSREGEIDRKKGKNRTRKRQAGSWGRCWRSELNNSNV